MGFLALALTYASIVSFHAKVTLITSLSEFISVFKQPTPSVVFRVGNYMCSMIHNTKQRCRLENSTLFKIKVSLILKFHMREFG